MSQKKIRRLRFGYKEIIMLDPCVWCGGRENITLDHIQPRSRGGQNHWWNYAPACTVCNKRKGSTTLLEYLFMGQKKVRHEEAMFSEDVTLPLAMLNDDPHSSGTGRESSHMTKWPLYALLGIDANEMHMRRGNRLNNVP